MTDEKIARINALAKKSRTPEGLPLKKKRSRPRCVESTSTHEGLAEKTVGQHGRCGCERNRMPLKQKRKQ